VFKLLIQCTKKLATAAKIDLEEYTDCEPSPFYSWHANLYTYHRRKVVMLLNNATRYPIILYGMKAAEFKRFDQIALEAIRETFLLEGFSVEKINTYIKNCGKVTFCKTSSRSLLGQMTDMDGFVDACIDDYVSGDSINLVGLNIRLGKIILGGTANYKHPIDLLKAEMEKL